MSLASMEKIRLVGHEAERERTLTILQDLGAVQICDLAKNNPHSNTALEGFSPKPLNTGQLESVLGELRYALDFIARYDAEKKGFIQSFFNLKEITSASELEKTASSYDYRSICARVRQLDRELLELRSEKTQLEARRTELLPWANLSLSIESLRSTEKIALLLGRLPRAKFAALLQDLQAQFAGLAVVDKVHEDEQLIYAYAIVPRASEEFFLQNSAAHGWERFAFQNLPADAAGTPQELLTQTERRWGEIDRKQTELARQAQALVPEKRKLQALYDYLHNEQLKLNSQAFLVGSPNIFILEGWVRARDYPKLERAVKSTNAAVWVERVPRAAKETPPVALENRAFFKPAEFLIRLFGLPHRGELDPTPFVLPFFAIFFGIALTDAGYGLALILLFAYLKRRYQYKLGFQSFANLIMLGGCSAVVAGAVTGGWFGPELAQSITWLKALALFDISTPAGLIGFLLFSFALGFVQIFLGNILEIYDKVRNQRFWEALWNDGSWMVFTLGVGIVAGAAVPAIMPKDLNPPGLPAAWMPVGSALALLGALLVLCFSRVEAPSNLGAQVPWLVLVAGLMLWMLPPITAVPLGETLTLLGALAVFFTSGVRRALGRVGMGLFRLYGATGLLGDVLSYSRIMALGVSTGLIAASMNKLVSMFLPIPVVGVVLFVIFLVLLQTFSLVINALSAFVHSARLHYVEFFTKFYEAGGEAFKPFARESIYYDVQSKSH